MIGTPLEAADVDGFGLLDYQQDISRVPNILVPNDRDIAITPLILDVFQCAGGLFDLGLFHTIFWITDELDSWDVALIKHDPTLDIMAETLPLFHHWAFEKNQKKLRRGVPEYQLMIDAATPLPVLQAMYATSFTLSDIADDMEDLRTALPHINELGWAYFSLQEWTFDAGLLLCSMDQQSNLLRVAEVLRAAKKPVYRIT